MSLAIWDHSATCHPTQVNVTRLNLNQYVGLLVLDLPTRERWKAELTLIQYRAYIPVYKMVLGGFLIIFLSKGTWTWKIIEVLFRHPGSNDVIATSNMAATGHDENPNFFLVLALYVSVIPLFTLIFG